MDREEQINRIIDIELDGMELDALMEYYRDERYSSLEKVDDDTISNILDEYGETEEETP